MPPNIEGTSDFDNLIGKWKGSYGIELEIKSVEGSRVNASYYNPWGRSPDLRYPAISRAEASKFNGNPRLYVEFSTGHFYDLVLEDSELRGIYYDARSKRFGQWVRFVRTGHERELTAIEGIILPKDIKIVQPTGSLPEGAKEFLGWWRGKLGNAEAIIVVQNVDATGRSEGILALKTPSLSGDSFFTTHLKIHGRMEEDRLVFHHLFPKYSLTLRSAGEKIFVKYIGEPYARGNLIFPGAILRGEMQKFSPKTD